jgi:succinate dehydrogenase / fumarate reductase membrane anchor subunit
MRETHWWLLSLASAVVIIVLLAVHFAIMHYSPVFAGQTVEETRSLGEVISRGRSTAWLVSYTLFLAVALYHGLYGLRGVILELPVAARRRRAVTWFLVLVGLAFFVYGAYVTWWTYAIV